MSTELMRAILALDTYNRGYDRGVKSVKSLALRF